METAYFERRTCGRRSCIVRLGCSRRRDRRPLFL